MRVQFERLFPGLLQKHEDESLAWQDHAGRLYDARSKRYLYAESQGSDREHEQAVVEQWLTNITCLQTLDGPNLKASLRAIGKEFRDSPFTSITDLSIRNIHDSPIDYHGSWACAELYRYLDEELRVELGSISDHSGGLLIIYGIGSAQNISQVIAACRPRIVLIIENHPELCAAKLDEEGCQLLLDQLSRNNTSLFLITESDPDKAFINARGLIEVSNVLCQEKIFSIAFRESELSTSIKERFCKGESMLRDLRLLGFFVDELHMSMNAGLTFTHCPPRVIKRGSIAPHEHHAVVVASGPSLKESIPYLQKYRQRFHLFSCYSTLRVMLAENIEPDYHCNQERHACHLPLVGNQIIEDYTSQSVLLCSANNDPRMNQMYKDSVAFFRGASSASALFAGCAENCISGEGTQVANLALFFAVLLGYRSIHLFGVDLGTANADHTRIEGAFGRDNRSYTVPAPGNRRETILTSDALMEVADYMGMLINGAILPEGTPLEGLRIYNYSDGLRIPGTTAAEPDQLDLHLPENGGEIASFIQTTLEAIHRPEPIWGQSRFLSFDWHHRINCYTAFLREVTSQPFDRNRLEDYLQSSERQRNALEEQVMPRLMAGSLTRAWYFIIMTHERLSLSDQVNPAWKAKAVEILHSLIDSMEQLLLEMIDYVERLEGIDQHQLVSTLFSPLATRMPSKRSEANNS